MSEDICLIIKKFNSSSMAYCSFAKREWKKEKPGKKPSLLKKNH